MQENLNKFESHLHLENNNLTIVKFGFFGCFRMDSDEFFKLEGREMILNFIEYAKGLKPYISYGKTEADFFVAIIGNFIEDAAMDSCKLLNYKPDTQYRYMTSRSIKMVDAQYVYDHRDPNKYTQWILDRMYDSDSKQAVCDWLKDNNQPGKYPENECQEVLEAILLSLCNKSEYKKRPPSVFEESQKLIQDISSKIESLPRPPQVPVPSYVSDNEVTYVNELFAAYGDAEHIDNFSESNLQALPDYKEDFNDRRTDYYAAVSIERGVMELDADNLNNQFDVLKDETFDGIKDTAKRTHANGYEKMLSVMEQVVSLPLNNYLLSRSPYWISGKIKKGVCHHLVNDGKLKWVKKNGQQ